MCTPFKIVRINFPGEIRWLAWPRSSENLSMANRTSARRNAGRRCSTERRLGKFLVSKVTVQENATWVVTIFDENITLVEQTDVSCLNSITVGIELAGSGWSRLILGARKRIGIAPEPLGNIPTSFVSIRQSSQIVSAAFHRRLAPFHPRKRFFYRKSKDSLDISLYTAVYRP